MRHHRVQPARADVLHALVHQRGDARDLGDAVGGEVELRPLGLDERGVLLGERVLRLRHDADEVLLGERLELDANREAPLQLRDQIARLGHVEGAGGDEEDVVGLHHAVLRLHVRAFDDRQEVALHAFARDVGAAGGGALAGDLVDLVEEDDAQLLDALERVGGDVLDVDELLELLVDEDAPRLGHLHGALLLALGHHLLEHLAEVAPSPRARPAARASSNIGPRGCATSTSTSRSSSWPSRRSWRSLSRVRL